MSKTKNVSNFKWKYFGVAYLLVSSLCLNQSCKTAKFAGGNIIGLKDTVDYLQGYNPYNDTVYYTLRMTQASYKHLRDFHRGKRLVAQVYFPKASAEGSPTLMVYRRTIKHKPLEIAPVVLTYGMPSSAKVKVNGLALGNMLLKIKELDKLIDNAKQKNLQIGDFIFTPVPDTTNPHLSYRVSLEGTDEFVTFNPSPPG